MADQTPSGLFLGADLDPATRERTDVLTTYEADRFTTHGVIVGMTGSGKTGLGVVLLEEVLASGVPALIIDPKGDLTNLALNFPDLDAASFRPWIDPAEAARGDRTIDQLAADTAASWTKGLASWGIDAERMRRLREGTRFTIYTPGSTAGVPLNLVGSLAAPEGVDLEALADEVQGFVTGLLGMAGIESDPLTSPEHILLTNLISYAWQRGRDLDLAALLAMVQEPPLRKLGVIDLDTFYPPKDRQALLIRLNGLLASPTFQAWTQGPPADIASMLWAPDGRPSAAIVTLSHLSDQERQFV
ncbi:MAG: type IV secretory system conjugative DNA transfer family protein, partial [Chloroflexota bacterium]|nr:type IV secretory system conjugative DNA transfer family protein [Chloroflexota bacterium]